MSDQIIDNYKKSDKVTTMKVKYRIVVDVESDTEKEETPDKWDMTELFGATANFVSYKELPQNNPKRNVKKKKKNVPSEHYGGNDRWEMGYS